MIAAVLAGKDDEAVREWHEVGDLLGLAFQIQDDILDITATAEQLGKSNSDARNEKITVVTLLGEENARTEMHDLYAECRRRIATFGGFESNSLNAMISAIEARAK
jgi:geranylgeranyl pyrophosphate synthase